MKNTEARQKNASKFREVLSKKWFIWSRDLLLLAIIMISVMAWQSKDMLSTDGSVHIDQQNLVSLQGVVEPLLSDQKPNLIYFFAPWCQICALSIGNLEYLNTDKVNIVVVALDYGSKEEVLAFVNKHEVASTVLLGQNELKEQFAIQGYPSYYLVDKDYKVVSSSYGYSTALGLKLREVFGP